MLLNHFNIIVNGTCIFAWSNAQQAKKHSSIDLKDDWVSKTMFVKCSLLSKEPVVVCHRTNEVFSRKTSGKEEINRYRSQ